MEDYLLGVLAAEIPANWPQEALKAQAVAARTYALYRKRHPNSRDYDIQSSVRDQVFSLREEYPAHIIDAVRATQGESLWWQDQLIPAFFHKCCGGQTEKASHVWKWAKGLQLYRVKEDPYCHQCPDLVWEFELGKDEITFLLQNHGIASGEVDHIIPIMLTDNQRIHEVAIITDAETIALSGNRFRQILGYDRVRSTAFNILELGDRVMLLGSGHGHGVGLCQWGAHGMSESGKNYREILEFYYPGVEVRKAY